MARRVGGAQGGGEHGTAHNTTSGSIYWGHSIGFGKKQQEQRRYFKYNSRYYLCLPCPKDSRHTPVPNFPARIPPRNLSHIA